MPRMCGVAVPTPGAPLRRELRPMLAAFLLALCSSWFSLGATLASSNWAADPAVAADNSERPLLFVGVFSSLSDAARRSEVRESWMHHPLLGRASSSATPRVVAHFVLGGGGGASCAPASAADFALVTAEGAAHGDLVVLPGECETQAGLPNKTIAFFHWYAQIQESQRASFAMKLDDDTFPNLDLLAPLLKEKAQESRFNYVGNMLWHGPVAAERAAHVDLLQYAEREYPAYMAGSGYVLSADLALWLDEVNLVKKRLKVLTYEDTTIGLFVHQENFMSVVANYVNVWSNFGCDAGNYLAMKLVHGEMRCMWRKMAKEGLIQNYRAGEDMCCRPLVDHGLWDSSRLAGQTATNASFLQLRR